jgi:uncharacterized protein YceH (UPF0502 family)/phospholipid N-methyltransferase
MEVSPRLDDLDAGEVRVLGCLIEKEATTPDVYPLTLNALRTACNQSTSRDPVVSYTDGDVETALTALRARGLVRVVHSTSNRAVKYRHVVTEALGLDPAETALLSVLLLRGAQTVGELKGRSERQHAFDSTDAVSAVLESMARREQPLTLQLERQPGQKDARWVHRLAPTGRPASPTGTRMTASKVAEDGVDAISCEDPYGAATAEFYDLLATAHWDAFGLELLDLLDGVDPDAGPIVDLGAGTGVGLPYLCAAVPDATILAIEPSKAMRTALHTRLAVDSKLRAITTVDPRTFADADLPPSACALVASAALGHLGTPERTRLWRYIAERMPVGAPAVLEVLPPGRPITVPPTRYRQLAVGAFVYEGWQEGEPFDDRRMRWTMTYRVLDGEAVVAEYVVRSLWRCFGVDDIRAEIQPFGLALSEHQDCVVVSRTADRHRSIVTVDRHA